MEHPDMMITNYDISEIIGIAFLIALGTIDIISGLKKSGIFPAPIICD